MSSASEPVAGEGGSPSRIRVLHVDDDPGFRDVVTMFLERETDQFEMESVSSADEALARLDDGEFDCVVSDYDMPVQDGIEFLHSVRKAHPDLPFILYTGKGSEEVASEAISAGATDYIQKQSGTEQYELLANRIENAVLRAESQRSERHLRELAENIDHVLYSFGPDWEELLFVNSAYEELWGRSIAALRASPTDFMEGIHPDDRAAVRAAMDRVSDGETLEGECRVNAAENYGRWVRLRSKPITDAEGNIVRVDGFATDITDRKELHQKLQKRTKRLQEAQRVAGVGSWEWDAVSDTVVWSDETYRIFDRDPEELEQPEFEDWLGAVHPEDRQEARQAVEDALSEGSFPTFQHRVQRPDGEMLWVECRGDVKLEDGEPVRVTGTILDISHRHETDGEAG